VDALHIDQLDAGGDVFLGVEVEHVLSLPQTACTGAGHGFVADDHREALKWFYRPFAWKIYSYFAIFKYLISWGAHGIVKQYRPFTGNQKLCPVDET